MHLKKVSSLIEYTVLFLKKYSDQQLLQNIYRIAEIKKLSSAQYKLFIQIIGKSVIMECTPEEIVMNDRMLEGFSKKDIRTITYLACEQTKKPKYKILMQEFCDHLNKVLFKLKIFNSNECIIKTAHQISLDNEIINGLSSEDIKSISYIAGYEHSLNQKNDAQ